ncbi:type II toxin-antitoxin system HigB family toxin [Methylobacterium sp. NEAU 140]|uniref:type II toxin-antitoxin system HigB family toxin n=1 Tax=Methylobacterium sp. NEAU 140 TaxID=3064945 RepID=UPI002732E7F8|nr:type II toxin-antitoxin system HigB family toxin [Methylobacterium sp. NEAU 140]MDP4025673.1 type II toxin-antitoxin system HigB family toxin [Methylobacterium sp. NEAU 140]
MRVIAFSTLRTFARTHPGAEPALVRWHRLMKQIAPGSMSDVQSVFPKAKVLNGDRVRFEVAGGQYRLIAAFDFERQIVFVKFIGTHRQYDAVDALTVSLF